jgi:hypothetical protein
MSNSLWVGAVRKGTAANMPTVPDCSADTFQFYLQTDTGLLKLGLAGASSWLDMGYPAASGVGSVPTAIASTVTASEQGNGATRRTVLTLAGLSQTIPNGAAEWVGTEIYDFPAGRILILGVTASLAPTTTSTIATTVTSGATGALAIGTVTDDGTHSTTKVDLLPDTAYTSSTVINVAAATVTAALAASAQFDGTATSKKAFLNNKIAVNSADGTMTWAGTITITWTNLGDY